MVEMGGYFNAVEAGMFVDSGMFPERNNDGIARKIDGGIGAGTIVKREGDSPCRTLLCYICARARCGLRQALWLTVYPRL